MFVFYIGDEAVAVSDDAPSIVAASEQAGFQLVTEVLGAFALAHPDGRTGLVRQSLIAPGTALAV